MNLPGPGPGRPKGAKNKKTREALERIRYIMSRLDETLDQDIDDLKAEGRMKLRTDMTEYLIPKLQRTEIKGEITTGPKKIGIQKTPSNDSE